MIGLLPAAAVVASSPAAPVEASPRIVLDPSLGAAGPDQTLPARRVACTLHRAIGVDPAKEQSAADIRYEGDYRISLALPPTAGARPADYRLVVDDQGLLGPVRRPFTRVADQWPRTVQFARASSDGLVFIILSAIDARAGTANGYLSRGADGASIDTSWIFQGNCTIAMGPGAGNEAP